MATQALNKRKEYAARSQASNIFDGTQQPNNARPGRRLVQGKGSSNVFHEDADSDPSQVARSKPAPAPFLTDDNAVNTHGRLGGYVNQSDSLLTVDEAQALYQQQQEQLQAREQGREEVREEPEVVDDNCYEEELEVDENCYESVERSEKRNENAMAAHGHKQRNQTSHIFDDPATPEPIARRATYDRNTISNVF